MKRYRITWTNVDAARLDTKRLRRKNQRYTGSLCRPPAPGVLQLGSVRKGDLSVWELTKHELEQRAAGQGASVRLTKNMTIVDMVKALEPEIRLALPAVLTPERFTRMALSSINNTPELAECTL